MSHFVRAPRNRPAKKPVSVERTATAARIDRKESQCRGVRALRPGVLAAAETVLEGLVGFAKISSLRSVPCANSAWSEAQVKRQEKSQQWYGGARAGKLADKSCGFNAFRGLLVGTTKCGPVRRNRVLLSRKGSGSVSAKRANRDCGDYFRVADPIAVTPVRVRVLCKQWIFLVLCKTFIRSGWACESINPGRSYWGELG